MWFDFLDSILSKFIFMLKPGYRGGLNDTMWLEEWMTDTFSSIIFGDMMYTVFKDSTAPMV